MTNQEPDFQNEAIADEVCCFQSDVEGAKAFLFRKQYLDGDMVCVAAMKITHEQMRKMGFSWES